MPDDKSRKDPGTPDDKGSPFDFLSDDLTSSGPDSPDKKKDFGALTGGKKDSGLGNLPPLSDFDSQQGATSSNLPPLGSVKSDPGRGSIGGLPPLSDISVDTPVPAGRPRKPSSFGDANAFDTPISDAGIDTPSKGTGFQDLAADSDFSPETPEIGPGPESDLETPLFDSAFGGGRSFTAAADTPAPTQAMETPMFGAMDDKSSGKDNLGFDSGAFGGGRDFSAGTPVPDFSPDTGVQKPAAPPPPGKAKKVKSGGGAGGMLVAAAVALIVGLAGGVFLPGVLTFLPNPLRDQLDSANNKVATLQKQLDTAQRATSAGGVTSISKEDLEKLTQKQAELSGQVKELETQHAKLTDDVAKATTARDDIQKNIDSKNEEDASAQQLMEDLVNQTSIVRARQEGLNAEVERLQSLNGKLEESDARRIATKDTLLHNVDLLAVQISEGISLTPDKFSREKRTAAVNELKAKVTESPWVSPALMEQYTSLYQKELNIAASREYFFARIPVTDRIGNKNMKWAECLMNGNWSVYYRTLDGKNIGAYQNTASSGAVKYEFVEDLPGGAQKRIEEDVIKARTPDYLDKVTVLAQQEVATEGKTSFQKTFDSL
ncbi:MAG: hypothetical protein HZB26_13385 [Candidatus Hydrogenedentes bacterium]|nr:hypothetical protein [Candidatus Hydrogenedentota bacterium]